MDNKSNFSSQEEALAATALSGFRVTSLVNTSVAPEWPTDKTVQERHDWLTWERETLLKRIKVQRLEREVRILQERLNRGPEDDEQHGRPKGKMLQTPSQLQDSISTASKQHRTLWDNDLLPSKHEPSTSSIKLVAPEKYNGKSISIMKEYISSCKMTFWLVKCNYPDNVMKVLYTS